MWEKFLPMLKVYLKAQVLVLIVAFGLMVMLEIGPFQKTDKGTQAYLDGDYATALTEFKHAASLGRTYAQFYLGVMYENGEGVEQDYAEAAEWYRLAANWNHASAQNNLGQLYYRGVGVEQDYAEALKLYQSAAEWGLASAQYNLAVMHVNGWGGGKKSYQSLYVGLSRRPTR